MCFWGTGGESRCGFNSSTLWSDSPLAESCILLATRVSLSPPSSAYRSTLCSQGGIEFHPVGFEVFGGAGPSAALLLKTIATSKAARLDTALAPLDPRPPPTEAQAASQLPEKPPI